MALKKNPLKLNKLQLRTLALAQVLANDQKQSDNTGEDVTLLQLPHPHGDHVHIGKFTVSARDASGFSNPAVWTALTRKGLVRQTDMPGVTLTGEGMAYDTGLSDQFVEPSDH
jgi:hypothetical protein